MNKENLAKYNDIMDTSKLVDDMMTMYTKYGHRNTEHGVCSQMAVFFPNKMPLIKKFMKSPNYKGDLRIITHLDIPIERADKVAKKMVEKIIKQCHVRDRLASKVDENGKTLLDYLSVGQKTFSTKQLTEELLGELEGKRNLDATAQFDSDGYYQPSCADDIILENALLKLGGNTNDDAVLSENFIRYSLGNEKIKSKVAAGMKLSRAFQKIWSMYGLDMEKVTSVVNKAYRAWNVTGKRSISAYLQTQEGKELAQKYGYDVSTIEKRKQFVALMRYQSVYNKLFAQLSDLWKTKANRYYFVISLNPMDYLASSFGISWRSCHSIDRANIRHTPGHAYSCSWMNGTISYMLDKVSIVTYCLKKLPKEDMHEVGRIYRCMFHYYDYALVQGRIYPKGNDGAADLYKIYRNVMQTELAQIDDGITTNKWCKASQRLPIRVESLGTHYRDYEMDEWTVGYNIPVPSQCNTSYPSEHAEHVKSRFYDRTGEIYMTIGHDSVCPNCGRHEGDVHTDKAQLLCNSCLYGE